MQYDEALTVAEGDVVRTDWGDEGEVMAALDTGCSVLFTLWHPDGSDGGRTSRVHNSHAWWVHREARHAAR